MSPQAARHFRVDPRLVHATTLNTWVPATGAKLILVVDGELEDRRRSILELSAMGELPVRFCSERAANDALQRCPIDEPVLVMFSSLESAERSLASGLPIMRLVIGHLPEVPGSSTPLHPAVHLAPTDLETIERLRAEGVEVIVQPLPSDKAIHAPRSRTTLPAVEAAPTRAERSLRVRNAKGLHLRAAQTLAQLAAELPGEVQVAYGGSKVNAKSLLGLTTLGASCGTLLEVTVDGPGAAGSLDRIDALFASGFEEGVDWSSEDGGGR